MNTSTVLVGTVVADPTLRVTSTGTPVCSIRLASTPRTFDRSNDSWKDGDTVWITVTAWRSLATNVAASCHKGDQVVVQGRLRQRSWMTPDNIERTVTEMEADALGLELSRHAAQSKRVPKPSEPVATDPSPEDASTQAVDTTTGEVIDLPAAPDDASELVESELASA